MAAKWLEAYREGNVLHASAHLEESAVIMDTEGKLIPDPVFVVEREWLLGKVRDPQGKVVSDMTAEQALAEFRLIVQEERRRRGLGGQQRPRTDLNLKGQPV